MKTLFSLCLVTGLFTIAIYTKAESDQPLPTVPLSPLENLSQKLAPAHLQFLRGAVPPLGYITVDSTSFEKPIDCTPGDFEKIERLLTLSYLEKNHLSLIVFAHQLTRDNRKHYREKLITLLKSWNRPQDQPLIRDLEKHKDPQDASIEMANRGRLNFARQLRLSGSAVEQKMKQLIQAAPSCLSKINLAFSERVRKRVTHANASILLTQLREAKNRAPAQESEFLAIEKKHPIHDGWNKKFIWAQKNEASGRKVFGIKSDGPSAADSSDDLFFEY